MPSCLSTYNLTSLHPCPQPHQSHHTEVPDYLNGGTNPICECFVCLQAGAHSFICSSKGRQNGFKQGQAYAYKGDTENTMTNNDDDFGFGLGGLFGDGRDPNAQHALQHAGSFAANRDVGGLGGGGGGGGGGRKRKKGHIPAMAQIVHPLVSEQMALGNFKGQRQQKRPIYTHQPQSGDDENDLRACPHENCGMNFVGVPPHIVHEHLDTAHDASRNGAAPPSTPYQSSYGAAQKAVPVTGGAGAPEQTRLYGMLKDVTTVFRKELAKKTTIDKDAKISAHKW